MRRVSEVPVGSLWCGPGKNGKCMYLKPQEVDLGRMLSKKLEGFKMPPTSMLRYLNIYSRPFRGLLLDS